MTCHRREKTQRLLDRAARLLTIGDGPAAAAMTRQAVRLEPSHDRARLLHARALLATGQPREALRALNAAAWYDQSGENLSICPADLAARQVLRAAIQHQLGEPARAARALREAVELNPKHPNAVRRLAALLIEQGRAAEAVEYLRYIHDDDAPDPAVLRLLAEANESTGRLDDALRYYEQLAARDEYDPSLDRSALRLRIARLLRQVHRVADARVYYDALLTEHTGDVNLRLEAAELALEHGDDARARAMLEASLRIEPDHPAALRQLAEQHMRCGRFESAGRRWHRLARIESDQPQAMAGLIVCALSCDRPNLADRLLTDFRRRFDPAHQHAALARAWRLAIPGRMLRQPRGFAAGADETDVLGAVLTDAAHVLEQAAAERPDHADLHYHHAVCRAELRDDEQAAASLDRALSLNGGYLAAARRRIDMLMRQHHREAAGALLTSVLEHKPATRELVDLQAVFDVIADRVHAAADRLRDAGLDRGHLQSTAAAVTDALHRYGVDPNRIHRWRNVCLSRLGLHLPAAVAKAA